MEALCQTLGPDGYDVAGFTSPAKAIEALREAAFDVVLTDLMMPEMDGIALLRAALDIDPDLVGIVMTGHGTVPTAVDAMKVGALDYIVKPFKLSAIRPVLTRALDVRRLRLENIQLREAVGIYEVSSTIARTLDADTILARVADAAFQQSRACEVFVLVSGQSDEPLRLAAARTKDTTPPRALTIPLSDEVMRWATRARDWLAGLDETTAAQSPSLPGVEEGSSRLALPMFAGGRLAGVLTFRTVQSPRPISSGQIRALSVLANAGAAALEVAALIEQTRAAERTLRRANDDLRQFAWAASHDLQEPLRMIALYTELLARNYRGKFDAHSDELVSYAAEGARRILGMIRELRTFVEAGDEPVDPHVVADANTAFQAAMTDLRDGIEACHADVVSGTLPTVRMKETHLSDVFRRLLDNALKFRRKGDAPRIEVSAEPGEGVWTFSVLDRGIGIDPAHHTQIFDVFRRLNRREDYEGSGMGLPVCRRIVEAYGGTLWVESNSDRGARFRFTAPALER